MDGSGLSKDNEKGIYISKLTSHTGTFQNKGEQCQEWIQADKVNPTLRFNLKTPISFLKSNFCCFSDIAKSHMFLLALTIPVFWFFAHSL